MTMAPKDGQPPHVLVVAYGFPPNGSIGTMRTLRLVRHLAAKGWRLTVLTASPDYYRSETPIDPGLLERVPPEVAVVRTRVVRTWSRLMERARPARGPASAPVAVAPESHVRRRPSLVRRVHGVIDAALSIPDREVGWLLPAVTAGAGSAVRDRVDVLYSSGPPFTGHLAALALSRLRGCPWVADFRDPWARAPWREDRLAFTLRAAARLERRVVARATAVVFATAANRVDFSQHYGPAFRDKFALVPNGCDVSEFQGIEPAPDPDRFVLLHAGNLYGARDPVPLFRALARAIARGAIDRDRFRLRLLGQAAGADAIKAARATLALEDVVEIAPRVPRRESLREMLSAAALLIVQPGTTVSIPGKLYEYLATGRPILAMAESGELSDLVGRSGVGVTADPRDEADLERALIEVVALATSELRPPARELYDGAVQAELTAAILAGVLKRGAKPLSASSADLRIQRP
jgi:glycosyltransferase involved in cell wall biosynthesis